MTNSGWLARAKHCTVIQILYRGYSVLKDGRWVDGHAGRRLGRRWACGWARGASGHRALRRWARGQQAQAAGAGRCVAAG